VGALSLITALPAWAAQVIAQAWLSQQEIVQAIGKLASANCSGSGKAFCL
jgi:ArsR family transcriptional regulator